MMPFAGAVDATVKDGRRFGVRLVERKAVCENVLP
jgi:hypothetical protein